MKSYVFTRYILWKVRQLLTRGLVALVRIPTTAWVASILTLGAAVLTTIEGYRKAIGLPSLLAPFPDGHLGTWVYWFFGLALVKPFVDSVQSIGEAIGFLKQQDKSTLLNRLAQDQVNCAGIVAARIKETHGQEDSKRRNAVALDVATSLSAAFARICRPKGDIIVSVYRVLDAKAKDRLAMYPATKGIYPANYVTADGSSAFHAINRQVDGTALPRVLIFEDLEFDQVLPAHARKCATLPGKGSEIVFPVFSFDDETKISYVVILFCSQRSRMQRIEVDFYARQIHGFIAPLMMFDALVR